MGDYNLSGLHPREFEHLTQSLAMVVIAQGVTPFGDGPDGGREATYKGMMDYPSKSDPWNGYLVIQSKFNIRPSKNLSKDGDWAVSQLRTELEKFLDAKRKLPKPEYYIFVTNVVLTPVQSKGSKDKVTKLLEEYAPQLGLKGFDIWDYDKLCRFLDVQEAIRKKYAPFILSGDVLAEFIGKRPDFLHVISMYLQKELLSDQFVRLAQAGRTVDQKTHLEQVFIDLPVSPMPFPENQTELYIPEMEGEYVVKSILRTGSRCLKRSIFHDVNNSSEKNDYEAPGRYVLVGGPGQGKSTVGQFICQVYRVSLLSAREKTALSHETIFVLERFMEKCENYDLQLPSVKRFPIRIVLNQFATELAKKNVRTVLGYICERIKQLTDYDCAIEDLRNWLQKYPWFIVLDGLDEVPVTSNREQVLEAINHLWMEIANLDADILVLATTRPQGYNDDFSPRFYRHRYLVPLSKKQSLIYAKRLLDSQFFSEPERMSIILSRLESACTQESTSRLMKTPLQVTIMATLVDQIGQPPQERWRLFKEYYEVIYRRETERDISTSKVLKQRRADVDEIHARVGLLLQTESERAGTTDAKLSFSRFEQIVKDRTAEEGHEGDQLDKRTKEITEAALNRLVFLVGLQENRIGFEIRSFQEFMAAESITAGSDKDVIARLEAIAPVDHWRNVFLFAAGKCFADQQFQHRRDTILRICAQYNDHAFDNLSAMQLIGSQLALDILYEGVTREQPKYSRLLCPLALKLIERCNLNELAKIVAINNSDVEDIFQATIISFLEHGNKNQKLGAWASLALLSEQKLSWALELIGKSWPDDDETQEKIFRIVGLGFKGKILASKFVNLMPKIDAQSAVFIVRRHHFDRVNLKDIDLPRWFTIFLESPRAELNLYSKKVTPKWNNNYSLNISFFVTPLESKDLEEYIQFKNMPISHSSWRPYISGARFIERISAEQLIRELEWLSINWEASSSARIPRFIPWPLFACLLSCDTKEDFRRILAEARNGNLGDFDDWRAAENRWFTQGISEDDLSYSATHRPFDKNIRNIGFPFESLSISYSSIIGSQLSNIISLYEAQPKGRVKNWLAEQCFNELSIFRSSLKDREKQNLSPNLIKELIETSIIPSNRYYLRGILDSISIPRKMTEEWLAFFDWLGHELFTLNYFGILYEKFLCIDDLSKAYMKQPNYLGILKLLSIILSSSKKVHIKKEFLVDNLFDKDDIDARVAAVTIRLAQGDWETPDTEEFTNLFLQLISKKINLLLHISPVNLLRNNQKNYPDKLQRFAYCVLEKKSSTYYSKAFSEWALGVLTELRINRISDLQKRSAWYSQLNLPDLPIEFLL